MIEQVPAYVSVTFLITSFVTVAIFILAIRRSGSDSLASKLLLFILPAWMIFQAVLASGGFYLNTGVVPPRLFLFGLLPAFALIIAYFLFARKSLIEKLPLAHLTLIHTIRIPVELVLSCRRIRHRPTVDLPQPDSPTSPSVSPRKRSNDTSSTA